MVVAPLGTAYFVRTRDLQILAMCSHITPIYLYAVFYSCLGGNYQLQQPRDKVSRAYE